MQPMMEKLQMSKEDTLKVLASGRDGVLASNGPDGYPYGAPVNYIYQDGVIYFHGRGKGQKVENITKDPKVCFTVYQHESFEICGPEVCNVTTDYVSVIVLGKCSEVTDQAKKEEILFNMVKTLVPEKATGPVNPKAAAMAAIYAISIEQITGKKHPAAPGNRTI